MGENLAFEQVLREIEHTRRDIKDLRTQIELDARSSIRDMAKMQGEILELKRSAANNVWIWRVVIVQTIAMVGTVVGAVLLRAVPVK